MIKSKSFDRNCRSGNINAKNTLLLFAFYFHFLSAVNSICHIDGNVRRVMRNILDADRCLDTDNIIHHFCFAIKNILGEGHHGLFRIIDFVISLSFVSDVDTLRRLNIIRKLFFRELYLPGIEDLLLIALIYIVILDRSLIDLDLCEDRQQSHVLIDFCSKFYLFSGLRILPTLELAASLERIFREGCD